MTQNIFSVSWHQVRQLSSFSVSMRSLVPNEKYSLDYVYNCLETSNNTTNLLIETPPQRNSSLYISVSDFPNLEQTQLTQDPDTWPDNVDSVAWDIISHHKLPIDPNIASLTRKYCNTCEWTFQLAYTCWKRGLTFLPPQPWQKMKQYNLKHGSTHKQPPTNPPVRSPLHRLAPSPSHNNIINTRYQQKPTPLCQHPSHTLTQLVSPLNFHPLLTNNKTSGNSSLSLKARNKPKYWLPSASDNYHKWSGLNYHHPLNKTPTLLSMYWVVFPIHPSPWIPPSLPLQYSLHIYLIVHPPSHTMILTSVPPCSINFE